MKYRLEFLNRARGGYTFDLELGKVSNWFIYMFILTAFECAKLIIFFIIETPDKHIFFTLVLLI